MLKPEQVCHINLMNWMRHTYPIEEESTYHIANERKCSPQQGALLKKMGVKAGVADLFIAVPRHGKCGLWLEIKVDNNKPTQHQIGFLEKGLCSNYAAACCWGLDACKQTIADYLSVSATEELFNKVIYAKAAG